MLKHSIVMKVVKKINFSEQNRVGCDKLVRQDGRGGNKITSFFNLVDFQFFKFKENLKTENPSLSQRK